MPRTDDLDRVRAVLDRDRVWSAYAIGDMSPDRLASCAWYVSESDASALALLYQAFTPPILFAMGHPVSLAGIFSDMPRRPVSLHIRPDVLDAVVSAFGPMDTRPLLRMVVDAASFVRARAGDVERLGVGDAGALAALFQTAAADGESPTYYDPAMLADGEFHGVRQGGELVAVAGTHVFSPGLGVCAIGNVYTRPDHRRKGLAERLTSAVVGRALGAGIPTIVLNVSPGNDRAVRVYERLGFRSHGEFLEGEPRQVEPHQNSV
jgi:ribosomal protein S18 acetylase RimI-like enzyme